VAPPASTTDVAIQRSGQSAGDFGQAATGEGDGREPSRIVSAGPGSGP
jgi:hypothetical protein